MARDPHRDQPIFVWGAPPGEARAALVMVHGRGGAGGDMRGVAGAVDDPQLAYVPPHAPAAPPRRTDPPPPRAPRRVGGAVERAPAATLPADRVLLLGFSQGACLALEFTARNALRYGGVVGLSGGLIGPEGTPRDYPGKMDGTPVFLGCGDVDPHVPKRRVDETAGGVGRRGAGGGERHHSRGGDTNHARQNNPT